MDIRVGKAGSELGRAALVIGDERYHRHRGDALVLEVDGVEQRLAVTSPMVLDKVEREARWGDLAGEPVAQLFADVAPGDHVACELEGWQIAPGTRVALGVENNEVVVLAIAGNDEAGARRRVADALAMRQAGAARARSSPPASEVVAPVKVPAPHRPWRRTIALYGGLGFAGVLAAAITWTDPRAFIGQRSSTPIALGVMAPSLVLISMALLLGLTRPWFEVVDTRTTPPQRRAPWSRGGVALGVIGTFVIGDICVGLLFLWLHPMIAAPIRLFLVAVIAVSALAVAIRGQRAQHRLIRLLRGSNGTRGTLVAEGPPLACAIRYDRFTRVDGYGDRARISIWYDGIRTEHTRQPFSIAAEGTTRPVSGERVLWGAPLAYVPLTAVERAGAKVVAKTRAQIEPGAAVLVRGKATLVDGIPTYQATGAEAFVMFGARGDARSELRRLVVRWYAGAAILVAITVGSIGLGIHLLTLERRPPARPVPAERG